MQNPPSSCPGLNLFWDKVHIAGVSINQRIGSSILASDMSLGKPLHPKLLLQAAAAYK